MSKGKEKNEKQPFIINTTNVFLLLIPWILGVFCSSVWTSSSSQVNADKERENKICIKIYSQIIDRDLSITDQDYTVMLSQNVSRKQNLLASVPHGCFWCPANFAHKFSPNPVKNGEQLFDTNDILRSRLQMRTKNRHFQACLKSWAELSTKPQKENWDNRHSNLWWSQKIRCWRCGRFCLLTRKSWVLCL